MTRSLRFLCVLCGVLMAIAAVSQLALRGPEAQAGEVTILQPPREVFKTSGGTLIVSLGQSDAESLVALLLRSPKASFVLGDVRVVDAVADGASTLRGWTDDGREIVIIGVASF